MATLQNTKIVFVNLTDTDWTFPPFSLSLFRLLFVQKSLFFQKLLESLLIFSIFFIYSSLLDPFIMNIIRVHHSLFDTEPHSVNHDPFFVSNRPCISPESFNSINHNESDSLSLQHFSQIKFLNDGELFLEIEDKSIIKRNCDGSKGISKESMRNIEHILMLNNFEQILHIMFLFLRRSLPHLTFLPNH